MVYNRRAIYNSARGAIVLFARTMSVCRLAAIVMMGWRRASRCILGRMSDVLRCNKCLRQAVVGRRVRAQLRRLGGARRFRAAALGNVDAHARRLRPARVHSRRLIEHEGRHIVRVTVWLMAGSHRCRRVDVERAIQLDLSRRRCEA